MITRQPKKIKAAQPKDKVEITNVVDTAKEDGITDGDKTITSYDTTIGSETQSHDIAGSEHGNDDVDELNAIVNDNSFVEETSYTEEEDNEGRSITHLPIDVVPSSPAARPPRLIQPSPSFLSCQKAMLDSLTHGRMTLSKAVLTSEALPHEAWRRKVLVDSYDDTITSCTVLLSTISVKLILALIEGNLPAVIRSDDHVKEEMTAMSSYSDWPGIYCIFVVDDAGVPPLKGEWEEVLRLAEQYIDSDAFAEKIDRMRGRDINNARFNRRRKYLLTEGAKGNESKSVSADCLSKLRTFIENARSRLATHIHDHMSVSETGYSLRTKRRIEEHQSFASSNYIMSLFCLLFTHAFPQRRIKIEGYTVLRCISVEHGAIGEILVSTLAQSYVSNGGGFCHQGAGEAVHSIRDVPTAKWAEYKAKTWQDDDFMRRINKEMEMARTMRTAQQDDDDNDEVEDLRRRIEVCSMRHAEKRQQEVALMQKIRLLAS